MNITKMRKMYRHLETFFVQGAMELFKMQHTRLLGLTKAKVDQLRSWDIPTTHGLEGISSAIAISVSDERTCGPQDVIATLCFDTLTGQQQREALRIVLHDQFMGYMDYLLT